MFMSNYSKNDIVLVRYPFTNLTTTKIRPAIIVGADLYSPDVIIVPLTSKITGLDQGEFILGSWQKVGLHVPTAVKRGIFTIEDSLLLRVVGTIDTQDAMTLESSIKLWLQLP